MSLQSAQDQIRNNQWDALRGGAARGDYTLPADFTKPYDALERLAEAEPPTVAPDARETVEEAAQKLAAAALAGKPVPVGVGALSATRASVQDLADWRLARDIAADVLFAQLVRPIGYQGAALIVDCLQPVFADKVKQFTADMTTLGAHAAKDAPDIALVAETDNVRHAYLRHYNANVWHASLRTAWTILRRHDAGVLHDPNGVHSLFAEIANAPEVAPDHWRQPADRARGNTPGPWPSHATPTRLAWILQAGGKLWLPTAAEQQQVYAPHAPDPTPYYLRSGATRNPYEAIQRVGLPAA